LQQKMGQVFGRRRPESVVGREVEGPGA
jgi:hypothetical protein